MVAAIVRQGGSVERSANRADIDAVGRAWKALTGVPDPEIPIVSIVELGIVRGIRVEDGGLVVEVTPTYSGCPATETITNDIRDALADCGIENARVQTRLSPAWTTDRIAPEAKRRLREFGIAPPHVVASRIEVTGISPLRRSVAVACPRCGSMRTRFVSQFGSTACKAHYRCDECLEPFDYFKPH
jgi:ring-1,2-phenylacetyl-CoA epoxidase subunit PaaD